ncbi:hypothetical protein LI177_13160 [bacterium 210820-DFI.6.37]|nr:hypothetical protein [bacterium 210820-DFI.6.37]
MKKRILSMLIAVCMVLTLGTSVSFASESVSGNSKTTKTIQPLNTIGTATSISLNKTYKGNITSSASTNYYKFTLSSSGKLNLQATMYLEEIRIKIFDVSGNELWSKQPWWNSTTEQISFDESVDLTSGTYYLCFEKYYNTGAYQFQLNFTSAGESFKETNGGGNNSLGTANTIGVNTAYTDQIAQNDDIDYYKFTLSSSGRIDLQATMYLEEIRIKIFDVSGNELWSKQPRWNSTTEQISFDESIDLTSGTYYLCFEKYYNTGAYQFQLNFTSAGESFKETNGGSNNTFANAATISLGKNYKGQIADNDDKDFYKFTASSKKILLQGTSSIRGVYFRIYDKNGQEIDYTYFSNYDAPIKKAFKEIIELPSSGTYYLCVSQYLSTGNYSFAVSKYVTKITAKSYIKTYGASSFYINASASGDESLTYTSSNSNVAYVSKYSGWVSLGKPGKATITIRAEGTTASKKITITVKPKKAVLTGLKAGKKYLKASWRQDTTVSGYEVVIAQNSKFTKGKKTATITKNKTVSKTFKKLKAKKTYYVKVRAYKKSGSTKIYGSYSKVKKVKVK